MRWEYFVAALFALLVVANVITTWTIRSETCEAPKWSILK